MADSRIGNVVAIAMCDAAVDLIDAGAGAGLLRIYSGTPPTNVDAAATGTLLAELTFADPAFGAAADINPGARATAATITGDAAANASGVAGYYRSVDSNGVARLQGDVTATGGGGNLQLVSTTLTIGQPVDVTSYVTDQPEA